MAASSQQDILELFDHAWDRFTARMEGLTEAELAWQPTDEPELSLRWRLEHIASFLSEPRTGPWLGQPAPTASLALGPPDPTLNSCRAAYHLWRLEHIASFLSDPRTGPWLGQPTPTASLALGPPDPTLNSCRAAYHLWRAHLHLVTDEELALPIGAVAGRYGDATRRSFALHILDELIHHTAEASLFRDLWPG